MTWEAWVIVAAFAVLLVWLVVLWPKQPPARPATTAHLVQDGSAWYAECPVGHVLWYGPYRSAERQAHADAYVHDLTTHIDPNQSRLDRLDQP